MQIIGVVILTFYLLQSVLAQPPQPVNPKGESSPILITVRPDKVYVENRTSRHLNFDFFVENKSKTKFELDRITLTIFDESGRLVLKKYAAGNGGVNVVLPAATLAPGEAKLVFNPFTEFDSFVELGKLRYDFTFSGGQPLGAEPLIVSVDVFPSEYAPKTNLILPLKSRLLIPNGSDFYSHHRRMDYTDPIAKVVGFNSNFMRYALDFVAVDDAGRNFKTGGESNEDFYGFGAPVVAPGSGVVVAAYNDQPDNDIVGKENRMRHDRIPQDPLSIYGNYVVIDHENGEFSVLAHLKQASVSVKKGDRVRQGQTVGALGSSGTSTNPHVHYELRTGNGLAVEGLPAYFRNFDRILGDRKIFVKTGQVNSGDIVQSRLSIPKTPAPLK